MIKKNNMIKASHDDIIKYVETYISDFVERYNSITDKIIHKTICRLELYVPLPYDFLGISEEEDEKFACIVRINTGQLDIPIKVLLLYRGVMVKPSKLINKLICDILDGEEVTFISDWE